MVDETEWPDTNSDLRQGDILEIEHSGAPAQHPRFGVVINADCDLANKKTDGTIAYLPLYPFQSYLEQFWAPIYAGNEHKQSLAQARELCGLDASFDDDLVRWVAGASADEVSNSLAAKHGIKANKAKTLNSLIARLKLCNEHSQNPFSLFVATCREHENPQNYAKKMITAAHTSMGDGHFFISGISGVSQLGFVIRMRRIYTIDVASCFRSVSEQLASGASGQHFAARIARLTPIYQYKVAQLFALQYSRIGLPDEITALSSLAIEDTVTYVTKV